LLVSYNWLKEYVDININPEELAQRLTMVGLEVSSVNRFDKSLDKVVVGLIEDIKDHPYASKLSLCTVNVGDGQRLKIICGAPNIRVGQKVPVAIEGAVLPSGMVIKKVNIRQMESEGMICSAQELGLDANLLPEEQKQGIMEFPDDVPIGADVADVLNLNDAVLELDLTPNRSDCLSVISIAREVAAICGTELRLPVIEIKEDPNTNIGDLITVEIADDELCGRYVARIVDGIKIKPSPIWMQNRLRASGVRPINNIVDVTNYVMLEFGQPLHAFDYRFIKGKKIIVRRAEEGEKIVTLDGQERKLEPDMLVIADAEEAVAIAGVMGGRDSEILEDTSTVLIESANFNSTSIRRTSRKLGLRSESSLRFEKGVNIEGALIAADRAAQLMAQLGGGHIVKGVVDNYPRKWLPVNIELRPYKVNEFLGIELDPQVIKETLEKIGLTIKDREDGCFTVSVPPFRLDLEREIDLVEEVARLYGYDKIPSTIPSGDIGHIKKNRMQILEEKCKNILTACGLMEVITFSFTSPKVFDKLGLPQEHPLRNAVTLANPLSEETSILRTTLIPNLLEVAQRNTHRKVNNLRIFEIGRIFLPIEGQELPREETVIAGLIMGALEKGWNWESQKLDFFYLKGVLEELFEHLNVGDVVWEPTSDYPGMHPGKTAEIKAKGIYLGFIGEIHPSVIENFELPTQASVFQINFEALAQTSESVKMYRPLPKYPSAERDMAFIVSENIPAAEIEKAIREVGGKILKSCRIFDVYKGRQIPEGKRSLAFSLVYQAEDRTLTDEEVDALHERIKSEMVKRFNAQLR